jgi:hydrogenase maturation protease
VLVIAVGNVFRADDGAGPHVAARVRTLNLPRVTVVEALGDVGLIDLWAGQEHVILLDAVRSGAPPGTVIRRDLAAAALPREWFHLSSHQLGVADAVELARKMGRLPARLVFVGIEGERFENGVGLSPPVTAALDDAARMVEREAEEAKTADGGDGPRV